jgi:integrase
MTATPTMLALVQEYLAFRRTLGFALGTAGQELLLFARYAERTGHRGPVTTELAVRWAQLPAQASPAYWAWRLQAVRLFAQHRALEDPRTEVPPAGLLGPTYRRGQPHIYSPDEVAALLRAARTLRRRMRPHTCGTLFGLLASTGLRVGEALALKREHVDLEVGVLSVIKSKACKSRLVPLHASTTEALRRYAVVRDRIHPAPRSNAFFLTDRGTALTYLGDRALARAREPRHHAPLHRGGSGDEGTGAGEAPGPTQYSVSLSRERSAPRVPRRPLIMRSSSVRTTARNRAGRHQLRIIRRYA